MSEVRTRESVNGTDMRLGRGNCPTPRQIFLGSNPGGFKPPGVGVSPKRFRFSALNGWHKCFVIILSSDENFWSLTPHIVPGMDGTIFL